MLAWMGYATLVGALLAGAGALLEQFSPWLSGRRRFVWLGGIVGSLLLAVAVTVSPNAPSAPTSRASAPDMSPSVPVVSAAKEGTSLTPLGTTEYSSLGTIGARASSPSLDVILIVAWLLCSALCMVVLIVSAWRVSRMRRAWRESVIAGVPVLVSHDVGPAVIGLVHHGIVVPSWVEALRDDEQRTVMTHEREHVRAGDPLLLWGSTLLVALVPWNVALWYALRRLRHAIEMDCDARVLRSRPDARAYCTLLLDVGERTLAGVAPMAALAEPATLLERRIDAMTAPTHARRTRVVLGAFAALLLVAGACWAPRPDVAPRARIASLLSELNSLLAKDSIQHSLTAIERADAARTLALARASVLRAAHEAPDSASVPASRQYTHRVDSIAHADFPEVFEKRDDAMVVAVLFGPEGQVVRSSAKRFTLGEVFEVVPDGGDHPSGPRSPNYLLSRVFGTPLSLLASFGSEIMSEAPHAILVFGELVQDPRVQPEMTPDSLLKLASHYDSAAIQEKANATTYVSFQLDRNGVVVKHRYDRFPGKTPHPQQAAGVIRVLLFGYDSLNDDMDVRVVMLRRVDPSANAGPFYAVVFRPRQ